MRNLTIKNIPDELYERLRAAAQRHRRSMNQEAITCLDAAVPDREVSQDVHGRRAREIAARLGTRRFTIDEIVATVRAGRDRQD